jgi:hypothetical protein
MRIGRNICNTLKEVRLRVARANGIKYNPTECQHKGPCAGTCPKCEQEVRYIEHELRKKSQRGHAAAIAGVAAGLALTAMPAEAVAQQSTVQPTDSITLKALEQVPVKSLLKPGEQGRVVRGHIIDREGEPLIGASVMRTDTKLGAVTDINGMFAIEVPDGCPMKVFYVGYKDYPFTAKAQMEALPIVITEEEEVMGEVIIAGGVAIQHTDDMYLRYTRKYKSKKK